MMLMRVPLNGSLQRIKKLTGRPWRVATHAVAVIQRVSLGLVGWWRYGRDLQLFQKGTDDLVAQRVDGERAKMMFDRLTAVSFRVGERADRLAVGVGGGVGYEVFGQRIGYGCAFALA